MERKGRYFEFGYPSLERGLSYFWPDESQDYDSLFKAKKTELGPILIDKLKEYIPQFGISTSRHYPYLQEGQNGLALHLGDGGRWIEAWDMIGHGFLADHNLDSWKERAAGFNIGSDILEHLDEEILAPRISGKDGEYVLNCPLPYGMNLINSDSFNEEVMTRIYEVIALKGEVKVTKTNKYQTIENQNGQIVIQDGLLQAKDFKNWAFPRSSFVVSRLMSLCK